MVGQYSPRIYERSSNDDDFLNVSLGQVMADCHFRIRLSTDELKDKPDELELEAQELKREFSKMKQPVVVDLKKAHLGLVGEKSVIHEQLKLLVAQLTFFQSYHDLEIVTIYNNRFDADFQWMRWYPHLRIHAVNVVGTVNSERKRDQILGSLHQMIKNRKNKLEESKKESRFLPHLIFIIDEPKLIMDHSIMEYLDKEGDNLGFSIIYTTNMRANLPENIGTIVMLHNSGQATLLMEEKEEKNLSFELSDTSGINLEWMARNLSTLEHMQGISAQIPESITFFEMYQVEHPEELDIAKRWKKNHAAKSLAVPLGVRAKEDYVNLNLHEKAHGPHGLVAGTTGSGKSEIIQSYILSLAVNYHPYEVAFLLIDYKPRFIKILIPTVTHSITRGGTISCTRLSFFPFCCSFGLVRLISKSGILLMIRGERLYFGYPSNGISFSSSSNNPSVLIFTVSSHSTCTLFSRKIIFPREKLNSSPLFIFPLQAASLPFQYMFS